MRVCVCDCFSVLIGKHLVEKGRNILEVKDAFALMNSQRYDTFGWLNLQLKLSMVKGAIEPLVGKGVFAPLRAKV